MYLHDNQKISLVFSRVCYSNSCCGRMVSDNMKTLHLFMCVTGLLNGNSTVLSNESDISQSGQLGMMEPNATSDWNSDAVWLRNLIKTRLVPTVCVCGVVGNLVTLMVLACGRLHAGATAERKVNIWLEALAVSDFLLCVVLLPHGLMNYGGDLVHTSLSFPLLYQAYGSAVINNFMLISTWLTVAMSFGCYLAVCHPLGFSHNISLPVDCTSRGVGTRVKAGLIYVVCFTFNLPRFFEYVVKTHRCILGPDGREQTVFALNLGVTGGGWVLRTTFVWLYFLVAIVVPLLMLAFCNIQLINTLRQSRQFRRVAQH